MKKLSSVVMIVCLVAFSGIAWAETVTPLPSGFNQTMGRAINENNQVVGNAWNGPAGAFVHPFAPFYGDAGSAQVLDGWQSFGSGDFEARDISNDGSYVIGYMYVTPKPWVWEKYAVNHFTELPLGVYRDGFPTMIIEGDGLYGRVEDFSGNLINAKWTFGTSGWELAVDPSLPSFPWGDQTNTAGHAVDRGNKVDGYYRAMIKDPPQVPEPGILLLLGAGLFGIGITARRRMKK